MEPSAKAPTPAEQVSLTFSRLGCLACHARDGAGGPLATGRDGWFRVIGEADLGEEGKLPPHLEKVGGKLRREWIQKLLAEGPKVRPYMAARMPVFGTANTGHLPAALEAADVAPNAAPEPAHTAPGAPNMGSVNLREAAERILAAWEATPPKNANDDPVAQAMAMLRSALTRRGTRAMGAPRKPREGTKQEVVLAMLRRPEGATVAQSDEATGWAQHTVRGFFAGLKKRQGITVEIAERIRQVGPNKQGAKGSYTVYRVVE